jgi:four helix bundle protein
MHRFRDLEFYKRSRNLAVEIYLTTRNFPRNEQYGITNQIRRSAVSIPSNIAEGTSRRSNKEFSRFLDIAMGSAYELETQLSIAKDIRYLNTVVFAKHSNDLQVSSE